MSLNIFEIPMYYISFSRNQETEKHFSQAGFRDINHFPAVNGNKFNPKQLWEDGLITFRTYRDLKTTRRSHWGIPSLGAIGCTMSHCALWQMCIDKNLPFLVIVEEDSRLTTDLHDLGVNKFIRDVLRRGNIFVAEDIDKNNGLVEFMGLRFYIVPNSTCKSLIKYCFPVDVQTDWYIAHLASLGKVNVEGKKVSSFTSHPSSIQDTCVICHFPSGMRFYVIAIFLLFCVVVYIMTRYWK